MPTWLTATSAQPEGGDPGAGRSSRTRSPGDRQTTAFMLQSSRFMAPPAMLSRGRRLWGGGLFAPSAQPVEIDDDDDQHAGDDALPEGVDIEQIGAVVDGG